MVDPVVVQGGQLTYPILETIENTMLTSHKSIPPTFLFCWKPPPPPLWTVFILNLAYLIQNKQLDMEPKNGTVSSKTQRTFTNVLGCDTTLFSFLISWNDQIQTAFTIGNCKDTVYLQLHGQMSRQPKRCPSAMLDPSQAFCCVSGSL